MRFIEHLERESKPTAAMYRDALRMGLATVDEVAMAAAHRLADEDEDWLVDLASATGNSIEDVTELLGDQPIEPTGDDALRLAAILEVTDQPHDDFAIDAIWQQFDRPDDMWPTSRFYEPADDSYAGQQAEVRKLIEVLRSRISMST